MKSLEDFSWSNQAQGKRHSKCKECVRIANREHYRRNKDKYKDSARKSTKQQLKQLRALRDDLKTVPCADCAETYPPYVMDFDHRDGSEKVAAVGSVGRFWSTKKWLEEVEKCDVVCANCHRERTHQRRGDGN